VARDSTGGESITYEPSADLINSSSRLTLWTQVYKFTVDHSSKNLKSLEAKLSRSFLCLNLEEVPIIPVTQLLPTTLTLLTTEVPPSVKDPPLPSTIALTTIIKAASERLLVSL
jgi:hypothetical protein